MPLVRGRCVCKNCTNLFDALGLRARARALSMTIDQQNRAMLGVYGIVGCRCKSRFALDAARALAPHMDALARDSALDGAHIVEYARFLVLKAYERDTNDTPTLAPSGVVDNV